MGGGKKRKRKKKGEGEKNKIKSPERQAEQAERKSRQGTVYK